MKKGYVIAIRNSVTDPAEMETYGRKAGAMKVDVRPLVLYGRHETREGEAADGVAILEFESYEAAVAWYDSPDYADARAHRFKGAEYRLVIAEGF